MSYTVMSLCSRWVSSSLGPTAPFPVTCRVSFLISGPQHEEACFTPTHLLIPRIWSSFWKHNWECCHTQILKLHQSWNNWRDVCGFVLGNVRAVVQPLSQQHHVLCCCYQLEVLRNTLRWFFLSTLCFFNLDFRSFFWFLEPDQSNSTNAPSFAFLCY